MQSMRDFFLFGMGDVSAASFNKATHPVTSNHRPHRPAQHGEEKGLSFTSGQQDRKELPGCMGWAVKPRLVVLYKGLYYPVIRELL